MSKIKSAFTLGLLVAGCLHFSSLQAAVLTGVNPTIFNVGSGSDISYLVIDESTLYSTPLEFVYHYTYDSNNPLTGFDFLSAITNSISSGLGITAPYNTNYGAHTFDAFTYRGTTVAGTPFNASNNFGTYWSLFNAGGTEVGGTISPNYPPSNSWQISGVGIDGRFIAPGSWDGWTISSYTYPGGVFTSVDIPPSVAIAAVPEPATMPLLLLSLTGLAFVIRWRSFKRNATC